MADKVCKKIKFPGLPDYYTFLQNDPTLKIAGAAADAKQTGDRLDVLDGAMETKAERDGYYQDMTVGDAEQLVSSQFVEDNAPYKFRTSGGSADIGNRAYVDKIVGGTVAWNQQVSNNGTNTLVKSTNRTVSYPVVKGSPDHKYLVLFDLSGIGGTTITGQWLGVQTAGSNNTRSIAPISGKNGILFSGISNITSDLVYIFIANSSIVSDDATVTISNVERFDLTQMFGAIIADAIYAMEQATAGAGVAWFRSMFPNEYYEYNTGELISVSGLQSHDMVGFNLWDEKWEKGRYNAQGEPTTENGIRSKNFIRIPDGITQLYVSIESMTTSDFRYLTFDSNKNPLTLYGWTTPNAPISFTKEAKYIKFFTAGAYGNSYKNDICINLSHNGSRNGEFEPYVKHSYPLDSSLTLRGVPKWADGKLYFDGDEYLPDGKVNRRYGVVVVNGTSSTGWIRQAAYGSVTRFDFTGITGKADGNVVSNLLQNNANIGTQNTETIKMHGVNGNVLLQISTNKLQSDDVAGLMAYFASNPLTIIYELATPTEETAEAYRANQLVDDWGTEEYVSSTICPVGHETRYPANLRDKLQHLPDLASADGYYVVQQTGSQMSLVHFRIPQAPSTDGTYTLKATVSGGTPTYTWEEVTE